MKRVAIFVVLSVFLGCKSEIELSSIEHLTDVILVIEDRYSVKSDILGVYTAGIRLNSNGTYQALDDNYEDSPHWIKVGGLKKWWVSNGYVVLESPGNGQDIEWEIKDVKRKALKILEVTHNDPDTSDQFLFLSQKQIIN